MISQSDKSMSALIRNGTDPKRAAEIVGVSLRGYMRRRKARKNYKKQSTSPVPSCDPWRCPTCRSMINTIYCVYCRDRRSFDEEKKKERVNKE